jgi:heme-degrading monooxygenase HmoA
VPTLINAFALAPGHEDDFVAGWEQAREYLDERLGPVPTVLHASLSPDADYRFVNVAEIADVEPWREAVTAEGFPGRDMPGTPHPALYDVEREDGEGDGGVVLINPFEVPAGEDDAFLAAWQAAGDLMMAKPGFLASRLYRSLGDEAVFRWVNVARWESVERFGAAVGDPAFQAAAGAMPHRGHPALYEVVAH